MPTRNSIAGKSSPSASTEARRFLFVADWRLDFVARTAEKGAISRLLSPRAIRLLQVLSEAEGAVVTRDALMNQIWPDVHVGDESLTQVVAEVRRVLGDRHLIKTVSKKGYYLAARTEVAPVGPLAENPSLSAPSVGDVPLEAYLAINEAQAMAKRLGIAAANDIEERVRHAESIAPRSAAVSVKAIVLHLMCALHAGDRARRVQAAVDAAERLSAHGGGDTVETCRALGMLAGATGGADRARRYFGKALGHNPGDFESHYLASQVFFAAGDYRAAILLGENAAMLAPDDYRPAYNTARAALAVGDRGRAASMAHLSQVRLLDWLKVSAGEPRAERALRATRNLLRALGVADGASEDLEELGQEEEKTNSHSVFFYDVAALAHAGEISAAIERLDMLVASGWRYREWLQHDPVHAILAKEVRYRRLFDKLEVAA